MWHVTSQFYEQQNNNKVRSSWIFHHVIEVQSWREERDKPIHQMHLTRCLKITENVSFDIASEASYVYIFSGQKLIKNAKCGPFWRVFENLKLTVKQCYQTGQL